LLAAGFRKYKWNFSEHSVMYRVSLLQLLACLSPPSPYPLRPCDLWSPVTLTSHCWLTSQQAKGQGEKERRQDARRFMLPLLQALDPSLCYSNGLVPQSPAEIMLLRATDTCKGTLNWHLMNTSHVRLASRLPPCLVKVTVV
jgi:hypothetical protein